MTPYKDNDKEGYTPAPPHPYHPRVTLTKTKAQKGTNEGLRTRFKRQTTTLADHTKDYRTLIMMVDRLLIENKALEITQERLKHELKATLESLEDYSAIEKIETQIRQMYDQAKISVKKNVKNGITAWEKSTIITNTLKERR